MTMIKPLNQSRYRLRYKLKRGPNELCVEWKHFWVVIHGHAQICQRRRYSLGVRTEVRCGHWLQCTVATS